jgi:enediyne biosynthesis protein E4
MIFLHFVLIAQVSFFEVMPPPPGVVLRNAATPERHQIETMPGGVAVFDFDGDGRLDLYFTNGAPQPSLKKEGAAWSNRLYRNLGGWQWEDVTEKAGVGGTGYDMGVAAGDFDNDGHVDLFVTGVRGNTLYRNRGDGTFENVTKTAGIAEAEWSIAAAWVDYDNDGLLDLFIVNYVKWDPATEPFCGDRQAGYRTYCHPRYYLPLANSLYRNAGGGKFLNVSIRSGVSRHLGKGMGIATADMDGDGWMDIFVTNDTTPDFLFRNRGDGTFEEMGLAAGVSLNEDGLALSSMGVDFRDVDGDGRPDLFVTALANETFPLFLNLGKGLFKDVTYPSRLAAQTLAYSGWSNGIYDFDNDGRADLFAANGDVNDNTEVFSSRKSKLPNLLFLNAGDGTFRAHEAGAPALHRGAAFGDLDGDGRVDVVVTRLNEAPLLLRNRMGEGRNWLSLELRGKKSNRDAIGAQVKVTAGGRTQTNHVTTSVGYASSSQKAVHFGLGESGEAERVEIRWPSGQVQVLEGVKANQRMLVEEP